MRCPLVICVLAAVVAAGIFAFTHDGAAQQPDARILPVMYLPPVESIAPLTPEEVQRERALEHAQAVPLPEDVAAAEEVAPEGYVVCSVKSAGGNHAVIGRLKVHEVVPLVLWFYDANWRLLGEAQGMPEAETGTYQEYRIDLQPYYDGVRWVVVVTIAGDQSVTEIGCIKLPALRFTRKLRLDACGGTLMTWRRGRLVVNPWLGPDKENVILDFDPETGATEVLYQEDVRATGRTPFGPFAVSPDGRFIAFGRAPYRANREYGLWLLDTTTGGCRKILYDEGGRLDCIPQRWDSPDTLIFMHNYQIRQYPQRAWYRAKLKLPGPES